MKVMKGLIVRHMGREYKIGIPDSWVSIHATLVRDEFILEGGGFISSFQKIRDGIEFEVEVAEFDEASTLITKENDTSEIDPEYTRMIEARNEEWELNMKLKKFRQIEHILKGENLLD